MSDVWRLTVGDKVQENDSFTPLDAIIKKLINRRQPFKLGFGIKTEATVLPGTTHLPLGETEPHPESLDEF